MANSSGVNGLPIANWTTAGLATTLESFTNQYQYWPDLRKSFGQGILMFDIAGMLKGSERFIASESYDVFEENPPFRTMTIGDTVSGGASAGATITFNLADTNVDTSWRYYPRAGQSFWAGSASDLHEFVIHSVTAQSEETPIIVAYQKDSTASTAILPNAYIKAGQTFALSPAVNAAQGTAATTPTKTGHQKFTYYLQVLKDSLGWENAELARGKWFPVMEGRMLYNKELARMDTNLDAAMESAIWFGQKTTNTAIVQTTASDASSALVYGTQGIWDWIQERGYDLDFTNTTDFTVDHLYELAEYGETVGLPASEWMLSGGGALLRRIEKNCMNYIHQATGSLNELFTPLAGGGYKNLEVGFKHILIGGQKIVLHPNYLFSNPLLFGISTYGINDAAGVFPMGMVREAKSGEMIPNLELVYRGLGDFKDRKRVFAPFLGVGGDRGAIGGPITLESDVSKVHALVDFGVAFTEAWRGVRIINTDITNKI